MPRYCMIGYGYGKHRFYTKKSDVSDPMHPNPNDIGLDALIVEVRDPPMMALATTSPEKEKKVKEGNSMAPLWWGHARDMEERRVDSE